MDHENQHSRASEAFAMQAFLRGDYGFPSSNTHYHDNNCSHGDDNCSHTFLSKNNLDVSSGKAASMER